MEIQEESRLSLICRAFTHRSLDHGYREGETEFLWLVSKDVTSLSQVSQDLEIHADRDPLSTGGDDGKRMDTIPCQRLQEQGLHLRE
jgi:hypothetical protein